MKISTPVSYLFFVGHVAALAFALGCLPTLAVALDRTQPPVNAVDARVIDAKGKRINYRREALAASASKNAARTTAKSQTATSGTSSRFVAAPASTPSPFWQCAVYGSDIGGTNILIHPVSGGAPEIIIGGNSADNFGGDDFWQVIRYNAVTGNYDQVFVSPVYAPADPYSYSTGISRIEIGNVIGDSSEEIVVMLENGDIYLYDATTRNALGEIQTGISDLAGLALADLDGDGHAELIVTTTEYGTNTLYVFSGSGTLLWEVAEAGGYDVVAGQMDTDPAIEIATTSGNVVDAATHAIQWTYHNGFGARLKLAPIPGKNYQQLITAQGWQYVYSYDIAKKLPRWSITTPQDIGAIDVADVDGDGTPEVIIGDGQWGTVHVHDLVTQAEKWHAENPEHGVTNIAVGDVDGDGVVDLLWGAGATSTGSDYLYVAKTTGNHSIKWHSVDLEGPFLGPEIGDLDGDGKPELVVCSFSSEAGYHSGRILVFDGATLKLRAISAPVANNGAWTGVHDLKLRDVNGDGRMEIVIGADDFYDGIVEIYSFDSANTFKRIWTNATEPSGSPFQFVEVADLDGNGKQKIIAANFVEHTGSPGVFVYVYDYPSGTNSWTSLAMASGFSGVDGLVVKALDSTGNKKIAALVAGDLYTFDGPSRELESLVQSTPFTSLSSEANSYRLIAGDDNGVGHFLQYANPDYNETLTRQLADGKLNGVNAMPDGELWTGSGSVVNLRMPSTYSTVSWQSPALGPGAGRFVATQVRDGQKCLFTSTGHAVMGIAYGPPAAAGQLKNISTRLQVLSGDNVMIGGFTVTGSVNKKVLLRTLGPTLAQFGLSGALADPTLELYDGTGTLISSNDNWKDTQQATISATGLAPPNNLEPAIFSTLVPGNYTAIVRGKNNTTGVGLVEIYDADQGTAASLTNISTRGFVASGQNVMIGGFICGGNNGYVKLIVRALGPTLSQLHVSNVLTDPVLELRDANGALLASNDNWADTQQADIQASGYAPPSSTESAIIITRPAANTTAIVRGKGGTTGNALVEVYALAQ